MANFNITINADSNFSVIPSEVISTDCSSFYEYTITANDLDNIDVSISGSHESEVYILNGVKTPFVDTATGITYNTSLVVQFSIQNSGNAGVFPGANIVITNNTVSEDYKDSVQRINDNDKCGANANFIVGADTGASADVILGDVLNIKGGNSLISTSVSKTETEIDLSIDLGFDSSDVFNWNEAFSWGDHSTFGYLTSFIEINDLTSSVVWANVPDTNITESSVTQHESALTITESQISDLTHFAPTSIAIDYGFGETDLLYEPIFAKNTAFNKDFGTTAGTVAEGNDSRVLNGQTAFGWGDHDGVYLPIGTQLAQTKASVANELLNSYDATTGLFTSAQVAYSGLSGIPSTFAPSAHTLDSHSNVTITSNSSGEILKWNGSAWINNTLSEAGISEIGHTHEFYFNTALDTADDIIEGNTNKFITVFERAKLDDITNDRTGTIVGNNAGDASIGVNNSFYGRSSGFGSTGNTNSFFGLSSGLSSSGDNNSFYGAFSGSGSTGTFNSFFGTNSGQNAIGNGITLIGRNAGLFPANNTLQTPNSTAIGAGTIIDKANQAAIGDAAVTELKIGETLVVDKAQIVAQPEGVLVTKKVGGKTVVEVAKEYQDFIYILAEGQSNMLRVTEVGETIYDEEINNNIQLLNSVTNTFEVYNRNRNSIWRDFANKLQKETNKTIRIVLNAYSGNNIEQWLTGSNHTNLITILQNANIESNIFDVFLWHQGESNENQRDYPLKFKQRYDLLVSSGYLKDDVVTVVGELGGFRQSFKDTNTIINSIPDLFLNEKIGVANSYGLDDANIGDGTHYNSYGAWVLGTQRYYEAYNKAKVRVNEVLEPTEKYIHLEKKGVTHILFKDDNFSEFSIEDDILTKVTTFTNASNSPKILRTYLEKGISGIEPYILLPKKSIQVATSNTGNYLLVKDGNDLDYLELEITSYTVNSSNVKIVEVGTTYNIQVTGKWFTDAVNIYSDKAVISNITYVAANIVNFNLTPTKRGGIDITITNGDAAIFSKDFVYTDDIYIENVTNAYNTPALIASQLSITENEITDFEIIGSDAVFKTSTTYTYNSTAFSNAMFLGFYDYQGKATGSNFGFMQGARGLRRFFSNSVFGLGNFAFINCIKLYSIISNNTNTFGGNVLKGCESLVNFKSTALINCIFGGFTDLPNLRYVNTPNIRISGTSTAYFNGTTDRSKLTIIVEDNTNNNNNPALADIITQGGNVYFGETNAPVIVNINLIPSESAIKVWNGSKWEVSTIFNSSKFIIQGGVYADDAAAGAAGVLPNRMYKTPTGEIRYKL